MAKQKTTFRNINNITLSSFYLNDIIPCNAALYRIEDPCLPGFWKTAWAAMEWVRYYPTGCTYDAHALCYPSSFPIFILDHLFCHALTLSLCQLLYLPSISSLLLTITTTTTTTATTLFRSVRTCVPSCGDTSQSMWTSIEMHTHPSIHLTDCRNIYHVVCVFSCDARVCVSCRLAVRRDKKHSWVCRPRVSHRQ